MADEKRIDFVLGARDKTGSVLRSVEAKLDGIKQKFGRRGIFGDLGEILVGGGIVGGVTFLAKTVGEAADKAKELAESFRSGKISVQELASDLVRSIPVLGQMIQTADSIRAAAPVILDALRQGIEQKTGLRVNMQGMDGRPTGQATQASPEEAKARKEEEEARQKEIREQMKEHRDRERVRRQQEMDREKERREDENRRLEEQVGQDIADANERARREQEREQEESQRRMMRNAEAVEEGMQRLRQSQAASIQEQIGEAQSGFDARTAARAALSRGLTVGADESRFLSGRAESFRERVGDQARRDQERDAKETAKNTADANKKLDAILDAIRNGDLETIVLD